MKSNFNINNSIIRFEHVYNPIKGTRFMELKLKD